MNEPTELSSEDSGELDLLMKIGKSVSEWTTLRSRIDQLTAALSDLQQAHESCVRAEKEWVRKEHERRSRELAEGKAEVTFHDRSAELGELDPLRNEIEQNINQSARGRLTSEGCQLLVEVVKTMSLHLKELRDIYRQQRDERLRNNKADDGAGILAGVIRDIEHIIERLEYI